MADEGGFEPPIRFWRIHTFQACAFNHSATRPYSQKSGGPYLKRIQSSSLQSYVFPAWGRGGQISIGDASVLGG